MEERRDAAHSGPVPYRTNPCANVKSTTRAVTHLLSVGGSCHVRVLWAEQSARSAQVPLDIKRAALRGSTREMEGLLTLLRTHARVRVADPYHTIPLKIRNGKRNNHTGEG